MNKVFSDERTNRIMVGIEWERKFDAREWCRTIPYIPFKEGWKVKVIPPFAGAVARFLVSLNEKNYVSVYLDCYSILGAWREPYWEIYPYNGDTFRCKMEEVDQLIEAIEHSLKEVDKDDGDNKE